MKRENLIVLGTGRIESGKSQLLADRYVSRQPRVIHLDVNDEVTERDRGAVRVVGARQLYGALDAAAQRNVRRFNIAAVGLESDDMTRLFAQLAPMAGMSKSLSRAFGSVAIECGEVGALCQTWGDRFTDVLATLIMRSRHHGVSLFMATQYPYSLPPAIRVNAHEIFFFQQDDPQALVWARQVVGDAGAEAIRGLRDYAFVLYARLTGTLYLCDRSRTVLREFRKDGAPVSPVVSAGAPRPDRAPRP